MPGCWNTWGRKRKSVWLEHKARWRVVEGEPGVSTAPGSVGPCLSLCPHINQACILDKLLILSGWDPLLHLSNGVTITKGSSIQLWKYMLLWLFHIFQGIKSCRGKWKKKEASGNILTANLFLDLATAHLMPPLSLPLLLLFFFFFKENELYLTSSQLIFM